MKNHIKIADDFIETHLWAKLLELFMVAAAIVGLFIWGFNHTAHPLDTLGYIWLIGSST